MDKKPENNPYLTGPWPPLTDTEWGKIAGIIEEAAAALDAAGDLLLAESVHQLVSGSTARTAAAPDAASSGDSPPPDPEVIATPAEGMPFTHRVMLVAGGAEPWNLTRPRSAAEPRLEAWAASRLGLPGTIIVAASAATARCSRSRTRNSARSISSTIPRIAQHWRSACRRH